MTRPQDLADAYIALARANHYMLGITTQSPLTLDDFDEAMQILIRIQNNLRSDVPDYAVLDLALDLLEQNRKELLRV